MRRVFLKRVGLLAIILSATVSPTRLSAQATEQMSRSQTAGADAGGIKGVIVDSLRLLTMQQAWRTTFQAKTRRELGGPFLPDYLRSIRVPRQWTDGDSWLTNDVGHPLQGAASGFIWLNNKGQADGVVSGDQGYWKGRLAATAWATAYSLQFEFGPVSEASIGNVGLRPHGTGWTDHIMTPLGGLGWMVAEDSVDRYVIAKLENRFTAPVARNLLRALLNPSRSLANVAGGKAPWYRSRPPARRDWDRATPQPSCALDECATPVTVQALALAPS
jgi:hypothetical protein